MLQRGTKNEITYHYYRRADGRRVHRTKNASQVNVREAEILTQLAAAIDAIQITSALAEAIADALNQTHRDAMQAKVKSAEVYRAEIRELEQREDRLFDRFDAGEIDRQTHDRQLTRLRDAKAERFEKLRSADADTDSQYLVTAKAVLELARDARSLLEARSDAEKVQLLTRVVCNPRLDGRTVRYDLKKSFAILAEMRRDGEWRPQRDLNRAPGDLAFIRHVADLCGFRQGFRCVDACWAAASSRDEPKAYRAHSVASW